ncbi:molybdate ABC transporter substrate-binding protein [Nitriliruptor alkaliphilus]|uniref:molybdate ABC transporter substrate-binding protein n=1 Tax=Nitriliruptor alkaliphilus TaxID=427918 RepID=UPI001B80C088|nr:molybdate ABC transporter substrate-binding protein [Nitriliruptor alkaliphilus]
MRRITLLLVVSFLAVSCGGDEPAAATDRLLVAAASDLRPAFEELGERFTAETGVPVGFDFGSSGQLAQRLIEGAAFDLYASANVAFVDQVLAEGVGDAATRRTYAFGRLVIWAPQERWAGWERLEDLAEDEGVVTLAIANPEHAPYGAAAQEALRATGTLEAVRGRLVYGENISDTQRLVETGNADVGILALSLAVAADERGVGRWVLVDEDLHDPLQQELVVTANDQDRAALARGFVDLVDGEEGRAVMRRFGFLLPGDEAPS